jgi:hypothetical protein
MATHQDADDYITAREELDNLEVGWRASNAMEAWAFSDCFGLLGDRILNAITILTGQVAAATSWRGEEFPPEWDLPENWEVPRDGLVQDERGFWYRPTTYPTTEPPLPSP